MLLSPQTRYLSDAPLRTPIPTILSPVAPILAIQNIAEYNNVVTIWEMPWQMDTNEQFGVPEQLDAVFTAGGYHELHFKNLPVLPGTMPGRNDARA